MVITFYQTGPNGLFIFLKPLPVWPDAVRRYLEILKKQRFFDELGK
nr:hypothetical protein [Lactobacillus amylovorus]